MTAVFCKSVDLRGATQLLFSEVQSIVTGSCVRIIGSQSVRYAAIDQPRSDFPRMIEAYERVNNFRPSAVTPSYGLLESP